MLGENENIIQDAIGTALKGQIATMVARFDQANAIIESFPYQSADTMMLASRWSALKPVVDGIRNEAMMGSLVQSTIDLEVLSPQIDKLFSDAKAYLSRQRAGGQEYYQAKPSQGQYFTPGSGGYFPAGSPDAIARELKEHPVRGLGIPAWMWLMGGTILALWAFRGGSR